MLVTSAPNSPAVERRHREVRYAITMGIRMVCFLLIIVVPGWWKAVMLAGAVILPAIAVIAANAVDRRAEQPTPRAADPGDGRAIATGPVLRADETDDFVNETNDPADETDDPADKAGGHR